LIACALRGESGEAYNLASGKEISILELAKLINEITGNKTPIDLKPARNWDRSGKRFGSTKKSREKLAFETSVLMRDGLYKTITWTEENHDLIAQAMNNHKVFLPEVSQYLS
jgi:nucleoside-diphosphate-sugar epimerase